MLHLHRLCTLCGILCLTTPALDARQPVRAKHAMVAARERHATDAQEAILESGGNAIDAAIGLKYVHQKHGNAQEAPDQHRIHHQWMRDALVMEKNFSPDTAPYGRVEAAAKGY